MLSSKNLISDARQGAPASVGRPRGRLIFPAALLTIAAVATAMSQEVQRSAEPAPVAATTVTSAPVAPAAVVPTPIAPTTTTTATTVTPPPAVTVVVPPPPSPAKPDKPDNRPLTRPLWHQLTPAQQKALEPLAGEWNTLDEYRKSKWLAIGNKFHKMQPAEQERIQARMRDWVQLTPEQRRLARESYARAKKIDATQKSAKWEEYQQLSDESKKQLADTAPPPMKKQPVTTLPSSASQGKVKTVPPIHSASQPALKESLIPRPAAPPSRATSPPATPQLQPAAQPVPPAPVPQPSSQPAASQ